MKYYRTKCSYVQAHQYDGKGIRNIPLWLRELAKTYVCDFSVSQYGTSILVDGNKPVYEGQWIVFNECEEFDVLDDAEFVAKFDEVM